MGLNRKYLNFIEENMHKIFKGPQGLAGYRDLKILELGDQVIDDNSIKEKTGKEYFGNMKPEHWHLDGIPHTSVDLNGNHGALIKDLRKPEDFEEFYNDRFRVITNCGTTEHVEPIEKQWECFKIIHDCASSGLIVHIVPDVNSRDRVGKWLDHCRLYYSLEFFKVLAEKNNYEIVDKTYIDGLIAIAYRKTSNSKWNITRKELLKNIHYREYSYNSKTAKFVRWATKYTPQSIKNIIKSILKQKT